MAPQGHSLAHMAQPVQLPQDRQLHLRVHHLAWRIAKPPGKRSTYRPSRARRRLGTQVASIDGAVYRGTMDVSKGIRQVLDDEPRVWFAFLFGSRGRGSARPGSDWDVAVYLDDSLDDRQRLNIRRAL